MDLDNLRTQPNYITTCNITPKIYKTFDFLQQKSKTITWYGGEATNPYYHMDQHLTPYTAGAMQELNPFSVVFPSNGE